MNDRILITAEELRKLVSYDPETGEFVWLKRALRPDLERIDKCRNARLAGETVALRLDKRGYRQIGIAPFSNLFAHRLAWLYVYGEWPSTEIDPIDGNPLNNKIVNLRLASRTENNRNQKIRTDNTSGVKGVSWSKKEQKWYAYINIKRKMICLGRYEDKNVAIRVRIEAERKMFGEFMRPINL